MCPETTQFSNYQTLAFSLSLSNFSPPWLHGGYLPPSSTPPFIDHQLDLHLLTPPEPHAHYLNPNLLLPVTSAVAAPTKPVATTPGEGSNYGKITDEFIGADTIGQVCQVIVSSLM
ncbi:unnamed protein product [Lactuca virosa]|uniref:Uncharacterized protein n=1 Tax=Lactuca virosa TaxID=75947 RepID=A0AAU9M988_9ASTR|nr:unnamed protein product [Lactuca virosa]